MNEIKNLKALQSLIANSHRGTTSSGGRMHSHITTKTFQLDGLANFAPLSHTWRPGVPLEPWKTPEMDLKAWSIASLRYYINTFISLL